MLHHMWSMLHVNVMRLLRSHQITSLALSAVCLFSAQISFKLFPADVSKPCPMYTSYKIPCFYDEGWNCGCWLVLAWMDQKIYPIKEKPWRLCEILFQFVVQNLFTHCCTQLSLELQPQRTNITLLGLLLTILTLFLPCEVVEGVVRGKKVWVW